MLARDLACAAAAGGPEEAGPVLSLELLPAAAAAGAQPAELRTLLNGSPDIPVRTLRRAARYANGYDKGSKAVEYLWATLEEATQAQRSMVLNFVTGCPKLPLDELSMEIVRSELGPDALPTSHTCFNQLVLPDYTTQEQLQEKLFVALESAEGFHMS